MALTVLAEGRWRDLALTLTLVGIFVLEAGSLWLEKRPAAWIDGGLRQPPKADGRSRAAGNLFRRTLARRASCFALFRDVIEPRLARITSQDADTYFAIIDQFVRVAKAKYGVPTTIIVLPDLPGYLAQ